MNASSSTPPNTDSLARELEALRCQLAAQQRLAKAAIRQKDALLAKRDAAIARHEQTIAEHQQTIAEQRHTIDARDERIAQLQEQLQLLLSKRYRSRSETLDNLQGSLFDESELERDIDDLRQALDAAQQGAGADEDTKGSGAKPRKRPKRTALPAHLRRVDIELDVSEAQKREMGDGWECIGYDISEQLAVQQRQYFVKVFKRKKYVRKHEVDASELSAGDAGICLAPPAQVMLPKSIADASLLAEVVGEKFIDALSFVRAHRRLARDGIDIGYSTLCDWPIALYERLEPFRALWFEALGSCALWQLDETTLQVLKEPGRDNRKKSYLWTVRAGPPERPIVLFHYDPGRDNGALQQWLAPALAHFRGAILTDEHGAYNVMARNHPGIEVHAGCWAHARRKLADAAKGRRDTSDAHRLLKLIATLYKTDNRLKGLDDEAKCQARQKAVKPIVESIFNFAQTIEGNYLNKGLMKTALGYLTNHRDKLSAFLDHPILPLDNNATERAIRPFTIGRKNWVIAGSPRGAHASAFLYSIIETAKANGLEPKAYLSELFERYPLARTDEQRRELLPFNFKSS